MTDETTTEQLVDTSGRDIAQYLVSQVLDAIQREEAEIERQPEPEPQPEPVQVPEPQAADTAATEYRPPEGWRVVQIGEVVQKDDIFLAVNGEHWPAKCIGETVRNNRYIRRIEVSQPCAPCDSGDTGDTTTSEQLAEIDRDMADIERQVAELVEESQQADYPQPEPEAQPVQVREGRWRTRNGLVKDVTAMPTDHEDFAAAYPWWDGVSTWRNDGRWLAGGSTMDLLEYLGPIEPQPEPVPEPQPQPQPQPQPDTEAIEELRSEVSYVQRLLGESRQRVTQLEELVASLRTINEGAEKAVSGAGVVNDSLRLQLAAVKAELVTQAETSRRLQIELDASQQVPADSPELRQLRLDLAEVTQDRDQYKDAYTRLSAFVETIRETAKAEAVQAIVEWLVPIRTCGSQALATAVISNLPHIMRSLTGLEDEGIE